MAENRSTQQLGGVRGSSDFTPEIDVTLWLMLLFSSLYDLVLLISCFRIAQFVGKVQLTYASFLSNATILLSNEKSWTSMGCRECHPWRAQSTSDGTWPSLSLQTIGITSCAQRFPIEISHRVQVS
jgi:hypothetical protein